jgi:hypothetical protein
MVVLADVSMVAVVVTVVAGVGGGSNNAFS